MFIYSRFSAHVLIMWLQRRVTYSSSNGTTSSKNGHDMRYQFINDNITFIWQLNEMHLIINYVSEVAKSEIIKINSLKSILTVNAPDSGLSH